MAATFVPACVSTAKAPSDAPCVFDDWVAFQFDRVALDAKNPATRTDVVTCDFVPSGLVSSSLCLVENVVQPVNNARVANKYACFIRWLWDIGFRQWPGGAQTMLKGTQLAPELRTIKAVNKLRVWRGRHQTPRANL